MSTCISDKSDYMLNRCSSRLLKLMVPFVSYFSVSYNLFGALYNYLASCVIFWGFVYSALAEALFSKVGFCKVCWVCV